MGKVRAGRMPETRWLFHLTDAAEQRLQTGLVHYRHLKLHLVLLLVIEEHLLVVTVAARHKPIKKQLDAISVIINQLPRTSTKLAGDLRWIKLPYIHFLTSYLATSGICGQSKRIIICVQNYFCILLSVRPLRGYEVGTL